MPTPTSLPSWARWPPSLNHTPMTCARNTHWVSRAPGAGRSCGTRASSRHRSRTATIWRRWPTPCARRPGSNRRSWSVPTQTPQPGVAVICGSSRRLTERRLRSESSVLSDACRASRRYWATVAERVDIRDRPTRRVRAWVGSRIVDLSTIVKAYDVRGTVPDQLDEPIARALGAAFVDVTGAKQIVTAHDMRDSGPGLASCLLY